MARNGAKSDEIIFRREAVAKLRLRGLSVREIAANLHTVPGWPSDPETGKPRTYDPATVQRDLKALDAEWKANAIAAVDLRKARMLAETEAAKRAAWANNDLSNLEKLLRLEGQLSGAIPNARISDLNTMTRAEALQFVGALLAIIEAEVAPDVLARIKARIDQLIMGGNEPAAIEGVSRTS